MGEEEGNHDSNSRFLIFLFVLIIVELGTYLGGPCEYSCSDKLIHVICDEKKKICECEDKYPVEIGIMRGCEKRELLLLLLIIIIIIITLKVFYLAKQLGDQCFYAQTCSFFDPNAICTQIHHNAICQCKPGFHTVALRKGVRKVFCTEGKKNFFFLSR